VSNTAEYGGLSRRDRLITAETRKEMAKMLKEIQEGKFAKEWMKDAKSGMKKIQRMEDEEAGSKIEVVGKEIRSLFETQAPKKTAKPKAKKPAAKKPAAKKAPVKKKAVTTPKKTVAKPKPKKPASKKPAAKKPAAKKK
jgi:hypothetical protein